MTKFINVALLVVICLMSIGCSDMDTWDQRKAEWDATKGPAEKNCTLDAYGYRDRIIASLAAREEVKEVFKTCLGANTNHTVVANDTSELAKECTKAAYAIVGVDNLNELSGYEYNDIYKNIKACGGK